MFDFIEDDEKEQGGRAALWNLYFDECLKHKFFLDPNHECCPEDIEVLKCKLNLSHTTSVADRFFKLHTQIAVDRLKLAKALPTLRSIHKISSSNANGNVIVMLLKYLKNCICAENPEPEVALTEWYNIFLEIVSTLY